MVLFAAVIGSVVIIAFIMPQMADFFLAFKPGTDQGAILELSRVYRSVWASVATFFLAASAVISFALLRKYSSRFLYFSDYMFLKLPLFGIYVKAIQTMDFSFAMEMLTGAGINIHSALQETSSVARNRAYGKAISEVYAMLLKGEQLSKAFGLYKEFPPYISTWIAVGERTGMVGPVFTQIRQYFQEEADRMSESLINLLQPFLILAVGVIIIIMIMQFILPLFSLYGRFL